MRITVDGKDYFVHVRYELYEETPVLIPNTNALAQARTELHINDGPSKTSWTPLASGTCWCSVLDNFTKRKGRYRAFTRALQQMQIPHSQRGVWHAALREAEKNSGKRVSSA